MDREVDVTELDRTHWDGCWRSHHECALKRIERLEAELDECKELLGESEGVTEWVTKSDCAKRLEKAREEAVHKARPHIIWETYNNVFDAIFPEDWRDYTSEPMTIDDVRREVTKRLEYELEQARAEQQEGDK